MARPARVSPVFRLNLLAIVSSTGGVGLATSVCWDVMECGQGNGESRANTSRQKVDISYFVDISYLEGIVIL
jgi:hypothetical protein